MNIPASTYRIQFHKDFTFADLEKNIEYLHALGVTTIYASPIFQAIPGSMHGYDVTDPHQINPEIGSPDELKKLSAILREKGMTWIQDIVPNHMAFHPANFRLMDVLERGDKSPYYNYFDINWKHPAAHLKGKLQVPFLGSALEECIHNNTIKISFSEKGFTVDYFESSYPLSLSAYPLLFSLEKNANTVIKEFIQKGAQPVHYPEWKKSKDDFIRTILTDEKKHLAVLEALEPVNQDNQKLQQLLAAQHYCLAYWKDTEKEINYRRFFTVNSLICLRMEDSTVFDEYHTLLYTLYKEQIIQGIRIDHIDGLNDPSRYIANLRERFGSGCYIIAEKILEANEDLPGYWPLQGTSGYEFLSLISQLITNRKGAKQLLSFYRNLVPELPAYRELVLANKRMILEQHMGGEWDNLVHYFNDLGLSGDFRMDRMKQAIGLFMIALPVYRIYPSRLPLKGDDLAIMNEAFKKAIENGIDYKTELEYLKVMFTEVHEDRITNHQVLNFLKRLMQFTGPLTAKGVEDTTFYIYNALISHDEVGDAPSTLGISIADFHTKMIGRQKATPLSLNATATHDTKRGEDARLRLNVLCEFPDQWQGLVSEWFVMNNRFHKRTSKGKMAPAKNDEYYIYQSIAGGFPEDMKVTGEWIERLQEYVTKVVREAKVNSDWAAPDKEYEEACTSFISAILAYERAFLKSFSPFIRKITAVSSRYALGHTLIRITAPGIPDTYQGCELWDLSFVDPDNRRPVDYKKRKALLDALIGKEKGGSDVLFPFLEDHRDEGLEKLFVTWKALNFRKRNPTLFTEGSYVPLQLKGDEIITVAFARHHRDNWVIVVVPIRVREKSARAGLASDDEIILPEKAPLRWQNIFTGEVIHAQGTIRLSLCFNRFPVTLLVGM